jgi:hypothetical protein
MLSCLSLSQRRKTPSIVGAFSENLFKENNQVNIILFAGVDLFGGIQLTT